jgi:hypothetical protein
MSASSGNTFYITTTSSAGTSSTYLKDKDVQISQIILTPNAANDYIDIYDMEPAAVAVGSAKIKVKAESNGSKIVDLSNAPIRFANGIWVATLSTDAVCTIILNKRG